MTLKGFDQANVFKKKKKQKVDGYIIKEEEKNKEKDSIMTPKTRQ